MKEVAFDCLPSQLYGWARSSGQVPKGIEVGDREALEVLFAMLFPHVREYEVYADLCKAKGGGQSIRLIPQYEPVRDEEGHQLDQMGMVAIRHAIIVDNVEGTGSVLAKLEGTGLLRGQELIAKRLAQTRTEGEKRLKESRDFERRVLLALLAIVLAVLFGLAFILRF